MSAEPMNTGERPSPSMNGAACVLSIPGNSDPCVLSGMRNPEGGICSTFRVDGANDLDVVVVIDVDGT
jgi:hypothetical protein